MDKILIYGAGLAGLLAANMFRKYQPTVLEAQESLPNNHTALLRHRSDVVSSATSIPFEKVNVQKAIWYEGKLYNNPQIKFSNLYSRKVTSKIQSRSISNLSDVQRYIAPKDFIHKLSIGVDIRYGECLTAINGKTSNIVISTIPMPTMWDLVGGMPGYEKPNFSFKKITVATIDIEDIDCDVYQTIYYPHIGDLPYRISITKNRAIFESITSNCSEDQIKKIFIKHLKYDFGIFVDDEIEFKIKNNKYGKISPIDEKVRRKFITYLTNEYGIYSLGRFATWRNLLLDDVHNDVLVIEKMLNADEYNRRIKQ